MSGSTRWRPLLEADLADEARQSVASIVAALREPRSEWLRSWRGDYPSLAAKDPLIALLYAYVAQADARNADEHDRYADALCDDAVRALANRSPSPALHGGFCGTGWLIAHLAECDLEAFAEIDTVVMALSQPGRQGSYDLINGLVGFGVFLLERPIDRTTIGRLEQIVDRLCETAERTPRGTTWLTRSSLLPEWQRELSPDGHYDLGVAHGVPGVIGLLAALCRAGIASDRVRPLLVDTVRWLLAQRETTNHFPDWVGASGHEASAKLAWCYGDLGICNVLLNAARCLDRPDWECVALEVAARAATETPSIRDTGLCHGTAGVAHLFNRLFQQTGDARFAASARSWFAQTLRQRRSGQGVAGFGSWTHVDGSDELCWGPDPGFLTGAAGVGLALVGATESLEPEWDRVLLISSPRGAVDA